MFKRLKTACRHSLTIGWGYAQVLVSTVGVALSGFGDILINPDVKASVQALGIKPWYMVAFAVAGAITVICRMRTVNKATDENNQVTSA